MWTNYSEKNLNGICSWDFYPHVCDLVLYNDDDIKKIDNQIQDDCLIFIKTDLVYNSHSANIIFSKLSDVHQATGKKFNIMTHCSDHLFPTINSSKYDTGFIKNIFGNQVDARHNFHTTKVHPICQGFCPDDTILENRTFRKPWKNKLDKLVLPPGYLNYGNNTIRQVWYPQILNEYNNKEWFIGFPENEKISRKNFMGLLDDHKFSLCIPGNEGCQVNRIWESLAVDCVPVIIRECNLWKSSMEELLSKHNLPCVFLDSISDINIVENMFDNEYDFSNVEKILMMKYWKDFVHGTIKQ